MTRYDKSDSRVFEDLICNYFMFHQKVILRSIYFVIFDFDK